MKALFNVGDKVRVARADGTFVPEMREYIGKIYTIESVESSPNCEGRYTLEECGVPCRYIFLESALEKVEFTKDDLREFDIVELRNGNKTWVVKDIILGRLGIGGFSVDTWDDDLKDNTGSSRYDIMKVYRPTDSIPTDKSKWEDLPLIYKRTEVKEMTVEEISEALGYEVKVVKK